MYSIISNRVFQTQKLRIFRTYTYIDVIVVIGKLTSKTIFLVHTKCTSIISEKLYNLRLVQVELTRFVVGTLLKNFLNIAEQALYYRI